MKSFFISLYIAVCAHLSVFAQTKFSVSYNDTVSVAEPLTIKYIVEDDKEFEITPKPLNLKKALWSCWQDLIQVPILHLKLIMASLQRISQ